MPSFVFRHSRASFGNLRKFDKITRTPDFRHNPQPSFPKEAAQLVTVECQSSQPMGVAAIAFSTCYGPLFRWRLLPKNLQKRRLCLLKVAATVFKIGPALFCSLGWAGRNYSCPQRCRGRKLATSSGSWTSTLRDFCIGVICSRYIHAYVNNILFNCIVDWIC